MRGSVGGMVGDSVELWVSSKKTRMARVDFLNVYSVPSLEL